MVENGSLDLRVLGSLVDDVAELWKQGRKVCIVTSGAVALGGVGKSGDVGVAAGKGMHRIMAAYDGLFGRYGIGTMQVLLKRDDFDGAQGRATLAKRIDNAHLDNVIAIINENDVMSTAETTLGDNDALAALVACTIRAGALVVLSVENSGIKGRGGGNSKLEAIRRVESKKITAFLVDGKSVHALRRTMDGDESGARNVQRLKAMHMVRKEEPKQQEKVI